ncbi:MAG: DnaD domain protein [Holdemanella sp.]|nr:DnaD domain protein [Holdemanella sp.]
MELSEKIKIEKKSTLTNIDEKVMTLLYLPLIKKNAYTLYHVLCSMDGMHTDLEHLIQISLLNEGLFEKNRKTLEQFGLMKTYFNTKDKTWLLNMLPPKTPEAFLKHDSYARLFLKEKGASYFESVKNIFLKEKNQGMVDVSESFDINLLSTWNDIQENQFDHARVTENWKGEYPFDFDLFLKNMDFIFPPILRTKENLMKIAEFANIFGVSENDMKKLVQKNTNPNTREINFENLHNDLILRKVPQAKQYKNPYAMPPIQFLSSKQKAPLSASEKKLVSDLCTKYGFVNEVINVLIDYVLNTSNNGFNRNYVEAIASAWSRNKVDTYEKAISQTKKKKEAKSALPEWYNETPEEKADDAYLEQLLLKQKKMKGES